MHQIATYTKINYVIKKDFDYRIEIKSAVALGFNLAQVAAEPRAATPKDVERACANVEFTFTGAHPPDSVVAYVHYIFNGFFATAHATGLYNRQRLFWEALARIASIEIFQHEKGIFAKTQLPIFDLIMRDGREQARAAAFLVAGNKLPDGASIDLEKKGKDLLESFLKRAERFDGRRGELAGLFACFPQPFPKIVLTKVLDLTAGADPVGKYDSLLPAPFAVPIDLMEITSKHLPKASLTESNPDLEASALHATNEKGEKVLVCEQYGLGELQRASDPDFLNMGPANRYVRLIHPDLALSEKSQKLRAKMGISTPDLET